MKNNKHIILGFYLLIFGLIIVAIGIGGCSQEQQSATATSTSTSSSITTTTSTSTTTTTYASATLKHYDSPGWYGFDFATGATSETNVSTATINQWNPDTSSGSTVEGTTYAKFSYLWIGGIPNQKHMGKVALTTISTIPVSWDSGYGIMPLLENHAYVVQCSPEGYAKIFVNETRLTSWEVDIQYGYTSGETF